MVHSSTLVVATDGEHLMCGGFSLGETVRFGSLEFIADYFDIFSLSPKAKGVTRVLSSWEQPAVGHRHCMP
jgi:hypothetical protein